MYTDYFVGVVKTQWYSRWIKPNVLRADTKGGTKRELAMMHAFLDTVCMYHALFWLHH